MADESTTDTSTSEGAVEAQPVTQGEPVSADNSPTEPATDAPTTTSDEGQTSKEDTSDKGSEQDIAEWARKKGLPLSEKPTENELKLAKMQREAEQKMHQSTRQSSELEDAFRGQVDKLAEGNPEVSDDAIRIAKVELDVAVEKFFRMNPEAAALESEMAKLVGENPARAQLPLEDLYQLAQSRTTSTDDVKKAGAKEALQTLAAKQKAATPSPSATTQEYSGAITREELQQRVAAGDIDWIRKHSKEIDALAAT